MCGHGLIGALTILLEEKLIFPKTEGKLRVETPAGLVFASYEQKKAKVTSVKFINVPSFLVVSDLEFKCSDLGTLRLDISYGGNFYAIIDVQKNFKGIGEYSAGQLIRWSREIRENLGPFHSRYFSNQKEVGCNLPKAYVLEFVINFVFFEPYRETTNLIFFVIFVVSSKTTNEH